MNKWYSCFSSISCGPCNHFTCLSKIKGGRKKKKEAQKGCYRLPLTFSCLGISECCPEGSEAKQ